MSKWRMRHGVLSVLAALSGSILLLFLAAPLLELVARGGARGLAQLGSDAELRNAIALTAFTATVATTIGVVCGTPLAWALSRLRFRGRALLSAVLDLPLLIPHPVAGIALLLVFNRESAAGQAALSLGLRIVGTPAGIIAAMLFVSVPLYISGAREAFLRVDPRYEAVARTLGDDAWRAFRRVTLPLATRGMLGASVVMWARAVSEFGAIVILTYNPKTISVLSYDRLQTYGLGGALPVAAVMALFALVPLTLLRALRSERSSLVSQ
jgi:molybdate/tungstate transport system permease protein